MSSVKPSPVVPSDPLLSSPAPSGPCIPPPPQPTTTATASKPGLMAFVVYTGVLQNQPKRLGFMVTANTLRYSPSVELRNVIVFSIGAIRYAVELRWVREVVTLGFVTDVPTAPPALGGVCNLHGAILPVLDVSVLLGQPPSAAPRQGDGALVLEAEGGVCGLRVDQVDHVASLPGT